MAAWNSSENKSHPEVFHTKCLLWVFSYSLINPSMNAWGKFTRCLQKTFINRIISNSLLGAKGLPKSLLNIPWLKINLVENSPSLGAFFQQGACGMLSFFTFHLALSHHLPWYTARIDKVVFFSEPLGFLGDSESL